MALELKLSDLGVERLTNELTVKLYDAISKGEEVSCPFCSRGKIVVSGRRDIRETDRARLLTVPPGMSPPYIGITYLFECNRCGKEAFGDYIWKNA
jgi:hypothetical protein